MLKHDNLRNQCVGKIHVEILQINVLATYFVCKISGIIIETYLSETAYQAHAFFSLKVHIILICLMHAFHLSNFVNGTHKTLFKQQRTFPKKN